MLNSPDLFLLQQTVIDIIRQAAKPALDHWDEMSEFQLKQDQSPVTEIDVQIEQSLRKKLAELLPNAGFLVEEGKNVTGNEYTWVIDPIDQTKNFVFRLPLFYLHIALLYKDEPILGVMYNPVSKQVFAGSLENGTYLNGEKLALTDRTTEYIDIDFGSSEDDNRWKFPILQQLDKEKIKFRITGAAFAPYLLTGAINGFLVINQYTKPVDQYPRIILYREIGLKCQWQTIDNKKIMIAAREELYSKLNNLAESCITKK